MNDNTFTLDEERLLNDLRSVWKNISREDKLILLGKVEAVKEMSLMNQGREQNEEIEKENKS